MGEVSQEQIQIWREKIENYKTTYASMYLGKQPTEKLIRSYCSIYSIPWPLPRKELKQEEIEEAFDFLG